jgi:Tfp pilus assembly protein PilP/Fe-S-cluster formation regulator IscX/YfhJ
MKSKLKTALDIWVAVLVLLGAVSVVTPAYSEKELDAVKEKFPPGERYHTLNMRDPFVPLTRKEEPLKKVFSPSPKPVAAPVPEPVVPLPEKPTREGKKRDKLTDMPLIPVKVYEEIQETDPKTLADLKRYAELFNDVAELQKMDEKKYGQAVSQYRGILRHAQGIGETMAKTELQVDYDRLSFVGMIRKKDQRVALIQTQDRKGYTARVGTFMGPNLGVVEAIQKKRITIHERYRDYLGEELDKTQNIDFKIPPRERAKERRSG